MQISIVIVSYNVKYFLEQCLRSVEKATKNLEAERCDLRILLANTTVEEARGLGEQFTDFDFIVVAGLSDPPPP